MHTKTFLILFCTIIVFFIGVNDGAPAEPKLKPDKVKKEQSAGRAKPPNLPGSRTPWKTKIDGRSKKIFNDYKQIILKKLGTAHQVPATFTPTPEKVATQVVNGVLFHYLVKIPANKYAYVTIVHRTWKKGEHGKEENVTVRPQLYELNDPNL